jgi:tetratricopeptide (TPR) repeat protein
MNAVMSIVRLIKPFAFALLLAMPAVSSAEPSNKDAQTAERADAAYAEKQYARAMDEYRKLARKGDSFSQYRMSYMHLQGEGVSVAYPEAFAWAVLAAESKNERLETYLSEVKARVPAEHREAAQELAEDYLQRWGRMTLAIQALRKADKQLRNCTGSRLGTRCEEVYAIQMPKFWTINPADEPMGVSAASGTLSGMPSGIGGDVRDAEHYAELREARAQLEHYISNNAGTVELGELQVIEPEEGVKPADSSE